MNEKDYIIFCLIYSILFIMSLFSSSLPAALIITFLFIIIQIANLPFVRKLFKMTPCPKYGFFAFIIKIISWLPSMLFSCAFIYPFSNGNFPLPIAFVVILALPLISAFLIALLSTIYLIVDFLKRLRPLLSQFFDFKS